MGANDRGQANKTKASAHAQFMKEHGVVRRSAACPWHCGAMVTTGGPALLRHLTTCLGGAATKRARALTGGRKRK
jgi:hypothetical protein